MAKSNHLSGLLLLALVCIHFCIASNIINNKEQRAKIKDFHKAQSGSQEQRARSKDFSSLTMESNGFNDISREDRITRVKRIYDSQVGVREQGTNGGPQVEKYLRYVNLSKGDPWCAAFVCWVFGQAGVGNPKSGWSPDLFPASKIIWEREQGTKIREQGLSAFALRDPGTRIKDFQQSHLESKDQGTNITTRHLERARNKDQRTKITSRRTIRVSDQPGNSQLGTPTTGDIFGIYFPEKKRIAHVGFIDKGTGHG